MKNISDQQLLEIDLLLDALFRKSGYDFRQYAKPTVYRALRREVNHHQLHSISELIPLVLHCPKRLSAVLRSLSVNVTEFFREPASFNSLVEETFPVLKSCPFIKVWVAGCSSGKEVYSLAILLNEAGLLRRSQIYATDFSHQMLEQASLGRYRREEVDSMAQRYIESGGHESIYQYFTLNGDSAEVVDLLRENITFAHHNLVSDGVFGEMQLISCKNVLIYFDGDLRNKVIQLFFDSLASPGYLQLGKAETIDGTDIGRQFAMVCPGNGLYKKVLGVDKVRRRSSECARIC